MYFHPRTLTRELAAALYAPNTELHPSLLASTHKIKSSTAHNLKARKQNRNYSSSSSDEE